MASVVPLPFMNPNCMSSVSVCCRILCSKVLYMTSHSIWQQFDPLVRCIIIHCKCIFNKSDICCFREMTSMTVAVTLGCKLASFTVNIYCYIAKVYFVMSIFICAFFSCEWFEWLLYMYFGTVHPYATFHYVWRRGILLYSQTLWEVMQVCCGQLCLR